MATQHCLLGWRSQERVQRTRPKQREIEGGRCVVGCCSAWLSWHGASASERHRASTALKPRLLVSPNHILYSCHDCQGCEHANNCNCPHPFAARRVSLPHNCRRFQSPMCLASQECQRSRASVARQGRPPITCCFWNFALSNMTTVTRMAAARITILVLVLGVQWCGRGGLEGDEEGAFVPCLGSRIAVCPSAVFCCSCLHVASWMTSCVVSSCCVFFWCLHVMSSCQRPPSHSSAMPHVVS